MQKKSHLRVVKSGRESSGSEWVGGRVVAPFTVAGEGEPYSPDIALWLELPSMLVLAAEVLPREAGEDALARLLAQALKRPMVGRPRVPRLVRVATRSEAGRALEVLPDGVAIRVAPTPELDEIVVQMAKSIGPAAVTTGYLEDEQASPERIKDFFACAKMLYGLSPWKRIDDSQIIRIDIPELGIAGACLSVIGGLGESLGFVLFSSFDEYDAFVSAVAESGPEPPGDFRATCLGLTFEQAADLPPAIRLRIARHAWPVAGPRAYPYLERREREGGAAPLGERDFLIAAAVALTLSSFFAKHRREFVREDPEPKCETYGGAGHPEVTITYPYEAYELFDTDAPLDTAVADGRWYRPDEPAPVPPSPRRAGRKGKAAGPSEDEKRAVVREFKARHYERWLDEKIPALGGLTPRQASRTRKGLRKLDLLLRDMESRELTLPPGERYDFAIVRRELGMLE